jgi:hypothetical protein
VAADALFAGRHEEDRLQPMAHGDVAGFEDGPNLDGKGLAALVALVGADPGALAAHLGNTVHSAAMRANRPIRPKPCFYKGIGGFFIVEVLVGKD